MDIKKLRGYLHFCAAFRGRGDLALWLMLSIVLVGSVEAQPIDREMYAKVVGMNNKRNCPYQAEGWVVNKLRYNAGYLYYDITLRDGFVHGRDSSVLRQYFADRLRYRLEPVEFNYLYEKLGDIKGGFVYNIILDSAQNRLTLKYPPAEVRQIWADRSKPEYKDNKRWAARNILYRDIYYTNTTLPKRMDVYTSYDSIGISGDTITFIHTFYEGENFRKSQVESVMPQFKNQYKSNILLNTEYLKRLVEARMNLLFVIRDTSNQVFTGFPISHSELADWLKSSGKLKPATDDQIDAFIQEQIIQQDSAWAVNVPDDSIRLTSLEYTDRTMQYAYTVHPEIYNAFSDLESQGIIRRSMAIDLHRIFNSLIQDSVVYDGGIITSDRFYRYFKGMRLLYMEEGSRRAIDIFIPSEEIRKSPILDSVPWHRTTEYIHQQTVKEEFLRQLDEFVRDSLPTIADYGTLDSIYFKENTLHFCYTVVPELAEQFRDTIFIQKSPSDLIRLESTEYVYMMLAEIEAGIALHYTVPGLDTVLSLFYSPQEIQATLEKSPEEVQEEIRTMIRQEMLPADNQQCPIQVNEYIVMDSVGVRNGMYTYYYTVSRDFPLMLIDDEEARWNLHNELVSNMEEMYEMIDILLRAGYGICYQYGVSQTIKQKKSKKAPEPVVKKFCFSTEELEEIFGD